MATSAASGVWASGVSSGSLGRTRAARATAHLSRLSGLGDAGDDGQQVSGSLGVGDQGRLLSSIGVLSGVLRLTGGFSGLGALEGRGELGTIEGLLLGVVLRDLDEVVDDVGGFSGLGRRPSDESSCSEWSDEAD